MLKQVIDIFELLDSPNASGEGFVKYLNTIGENNCEVKAITTNKGSTDFVRTKIIGSEGKTKGGAYPTLGVVGRLGGLGARPNAIGFVSDGDGALAALAVTAKLLKMNILGDVLKGDVIICTHICPDAPVIEHKPVNFMDSPVNMEIMNDMEVDEEMDAILSVDTTKGNRVINFNGFAISNTIMQGYILRVSDDLLDIMIRVTGEMPKVLPLSQQDITPYKNGLYHINSILQPSTATKAPVVGVAITSQVPIAGCSTGVTDLFSVDKAARFILETAKDFTSKKAKFYDDEEFEKILSLYGELSHFQTGGKS